MISLPTIALPDITLQKPFTLAHSDGKSAGGVKDPGDPPEGALMDADGFFIVDRFGYYIVPQE